MKARDRFSMLGARFGVCDKLGIAVHLEGSVRFFGFGFLDPRSSIKLVSLLIRTGNLQGGDPQCVVVVIAVKDARGA